MTTTLALTFSPPPWTPEGAGDFQQLQALFKAAVETKHLPSVPRVLGEPVVVISREIWRRVTTTAVAPNSPQTILEYMIANYPGIAAQVEGASYPHLEVEISDMGRTARFQDAAIEALQKRVDDRDAEIARMRAAADSGAPDCDSCAAWDATPAPSMRRTVVMVYVGSIVGLTGLLTAGLVLLAQSLGLTEELARRLAQVAEVLEIPGVLRVHWPQWGTLRAIVAVAAEVPNHRESLEMQIEAAIDDPEIEHRVQEEPGEPAPGYVVRGGEAASAAAPDLRWFWRHSSDDQEHEQGPLASEAAAVDATWDEHAINTAEEMPSHAGDEP